MSRDELLAFYRRVMNHIHENGSIFGDLGRGKAYAIIAVLASNLRQSEPADDQRPIENRLEETTRGWMGARNQFDLGD